MDKLKYLLNNYIVYRDFNEELYYQIKDNSGTYKKFTTDYLNYKLIIRPDFIKLEKSPGTPRFTMGIQSFKSVLDYIIFLKLLYFLDNIDKGKQFLFSELKESINLDWLQGKNRLSLTRVLKYSIEIPIIKVIEQSDDESEKEILLESLGNSRYIILSNFNENNTENLDLKVKVYRNLIMNGIIYSKDEIEYEYCKKHKDEIDSVLEKNLNWNIQVQKNMVITTINDSFGIFNSFPGRSDDDKICLQFNNLIREKVINGKYLLSADETFILKNYEFDEIIDELREKNESKWTKLSREKSSDNLKKDLLQILEFFNFIEIKEKEIKIYPLCGKVVGEYAE